MALQLRLLSSAEFLPPWFESARQEPLWCTTEAWYIRIFKLRLECTCCSWHPFQPSLILDEESLLGGSGTSRWSGVARDYFCVSFSLVCWIFEHAIFPRVPEIVCVCVGTLGVLFLRFGWIFYPCQKTLAPAPRGVPSGTSSIGEPSSKPGSCWIRCFSSRGVFVDGAFLGEGLKFPQVVEIGGGGGGDILWYHVFDVVILV